MRKLFILSALLITACSIKAQVNLRPGYIITHSNDTIQGMIDFRTAERNAQYCDFRSDTGHQLKRYMPNDISAYRFTEDGKFYIARTVEIDSIRQSVFLEYLVKGVISLYYYKNYDTPTYFFEDEDGRMINIKDKYKEVAINDSHSYIELDNRPIGIMTYLFGKSERIKNKIKNIKINREDLSKITKEYHYETCRTGEKCIEFESKRDKHFLKVDFNVRAGLSLNNLNIENAENQWAIKDMKSLTPSVTAGMNISIPRFTYIASLNIEAEFSKYKGIKDVFSENESGYYHKFDVEGYLTDIRAGANFKFSRASITPIVGAGFCETLMWNIESNHTYSYFLYDQTLRSMNEETKGLISKSYSGFYVNAGVLIPLKKGAITVQILYANRSHQNNKITTWSGTVGYTF